MMGFKKLGSVGLVILVFGFSLMVHASTPTTFSKIQITTMDGKTQHMGLEKFKEIGSSPPEKMRAFPEQTLVPMTAILKEIKAKDTGWVHFQGESGKSLKYSIEDLRSGKVPLAVINANHGGWKLIQYTGKDSKPKPGSYYLRSVKKITLSKKQLSSATSKRSEKGIQCANAKVYSDLKLAMKEKDQVCVLNLSGQKLKEIPADVFEMKNIQELNLGRNQIAKIPADISKLDQLDTLTIGRNKLKTVPTEIGQLQKLRILKLGRNRISSLPTEIGNLNHLTKLELDNNRLKTVPAEVGNMKSLEELELAYNQVTSLPDTLAQMKKLEKIELKGNPIPLPQRQAINNQFKGIEVEWD